MPVGEIGIEERNAHAFDEFGPACMVSAAYSADTQAGRGVEGVAGLGWEGDLEAMRRTRFPDWDKVPDLSEARERKSAA